MQETWLHPLAIDDPDFRLVDGKPRPEFMLIGGAKCGSTSFERYLRTHPQVRIWAPKEPNYWSWNWFSDGYQDFFINEQPLLAPGPGHSVSGEFSTSYLVHPLAPRRVRANLPDLKIFVMLRNPIDRAYSHYIMSQRMGLEKECAFEDIVRREIDEVPDLLAAHERGFLHPGGISKACYSKSDGTPIRVVRHEFDWSKRRLRSDRDLKNFYFKSYVFRSVYYHQLHRWLQLFPRAQFMLIQSEMFFGNAANTMHEAADFLGLGTYDFDASQALERSWGGGASDAFEKPGDYAPMKSATRDLLRDFYAPFNQMLYRLIDEEFDWN